MHTESTTSDIPQRFADRVAKCVVDLFSSLGPSCNPMEQNCFTVVAGFVAETPDSRLIPVVVSSGTKCLGERCISNAMEGAVLKDSHAEILAKRALMRYIMLTIQQIESGGDLEDIFIEKIDMKSPVESKYKMKPGWKLHLYISDSPCGDAAIYQKNKGDGSAFTGAKLASVSSEVCSRESAQQLCCVRVKSGRSDITPDLRTKSLSCSDKIARWSAIGLQTSLVSHFFPEPIQLHTLVISADPLAERDSQLAALNRALLNRSSLFPTERIMILLTGVSYTKSKSNVDAACSMAIALTSSSPSSPSSSTSITNTILGKRKDRHAGNASEKIRPFGTSANWIRSVLRAGEPSCERTQAQGGYLIGLTKKDLSLFTEIVHDQMSDSSISSVTKCISRLSRILMMTLFLKILRMRSEHTLSNGESVSEIMEHYKAWKGTAENFRRNRKEFTESDHFTMSA